MPRDLAGCEQLKLGRGTSTPVSVGSRWQLQASSLRVSRMQTVPHSVVVGHVHDKDVRQGLLLPQGDDTVTCFSVTVNGALVHLRLAPVDVAVARIYATDEQGNPQPMHPAINLCEVESGAVFGPRREEFLTTWTDSFVLIVSGVDSMEMAIWLTTPKQFDITTADGSTAFSVEYMCIADHGDC